MQTDSPSDGVKFNLMGRLKEQTLEMGGTRDTWHLAGQSGVGKQAVHRA